MSDLGDESTYKIITTSATPLVSQVVCYDETLPHISENHPELNPLIPSLEHAIHNTIQAPTRVIQSNTDVHVNGYKFCSDRHQRGNQELVVAVKVIEGTSALLKTAYFTATVTGDTVFEQSDGEGGE